MKGDKKRTVLKGQLLLLLVVELCAFPISDMAVEIEYFYARAEQSLDWGVRNCSEHEAKMLGIKWNVIVKVS